MPTIHAVTPSRLTARKAPLPVENPSELLPLLRYVDEGDHRYLILERTDRPGHYLKVARTTKPAGQTSDAPVDTGFRVEYRTGTSYTHQLADASDLTTVHDVVTAWYDDADGWPDQLEWRPLDIGLRTVEQIAEDITSDLDDPEVHDVDYDQAESWRPNLRAFVRSGFSTRRDVVEAALEANRDRDAEPMTEATHEELVRIAVAEWDQAVSDQVGWTDQGDHDRLAAAFEELDTLGVLARMNFSCCTNCGHLELSRETRRAAANHASAEPEPLGHVFFHAQNTSLIADGTPLQLGFGGYLDHSSIHAATNDSDKGDPIKLLDTRVARVAVNTIRKHGLAADWNGDTTKKIKVTITDWRKRLPL